MFTKLDRYALRELAVPFLIGTVSVVLMFQANFLIALLKQISLANVPIQALLKIVLFHSPGFLKLTLPIGMSLASSLAMSRLSKDSELTAMRVAGASVIRVMRPVVLFGVLVAVANFVLVERIIPPAEKAARKLEVESAILGAAPELKNNVVIKLKNFVANVGLITRNPDGSLRLDNVLLFERPKLNETWLWSAQSGSYRQGNWTLKNIEIWKVSKGEITQIRQLDPNQDQKIVDPINVEEIFLPPAPEEQSIPELKQAILEAKEQGREATNLEIAFHTKYSVPAACVIFALVSPIFAILFSRSGSFVGVFLAIVMVLAYYNLFIVSTEIFGRNGWVAPVIAAWLPNVIFALIGVIALRRLE